MSVLKNLIEANKPFYIAKYKVYSLIPDMNHPPKYIAFTHKNFSSEATNDFMWMSVYPEYMEHPIKNSDIDLFKANRKKFKLVLKNEHGEIYEFIPEREMPKPYTQKTDEVLTKNHNFLK